MVTVGTIMLLWSTTSLTAQASSILQTRAFSTNLVKGEYVEAEAEEIITDPNEIEESEEPEDEHTDVSTPTDIESVVDEEPTQSEEPVDEHLDAPENIGDSREPEVETPIDSKENEEEHETEVQESE